MPLSSKQDRLYWQTWARIAAAIRRDDPSLSPATVREMRVWQHRAAKCPDSHKAWASVHLTAWLSHAHAVEHPEDLDAQMAFAAQIQQEQHPQASRIFRVKELLTELGKPVSYAAACAHDPDLPGDLGKWSESALQAALQALTRTARSARKRAQIPGEEPF